MLIINNLENIPIDMMGEGTANLLGLIVDLCISDKKIFLLEEPENDIHPKALKELLKFICRKAQNNQFIITTHSNIVMKYLGAQADTKIFNVSMKFVDKLPTSQVTEVENNLEAKRQVLEDLGYELFDFDLWDGWLILEESSAEKIIRDFLIPWFVPRLATKLRTFSARTIDEVESKFSDFHRLFVFLHLQPQYTNRAWVIVDSGEREQGVIGRLRSKFVSGGWHEEQFRQFSQHDFERFYPEQFQEEVTKILTISDKKQRQAEKNRLLKKLEEWIMNNQALAKNEFKKSAKEVIGILNEIGKSLNAY